MNLRLKMMDFVFKMMHLGLKLAQFDAPDRMLMMSDERIICFDKCYLL